jgi:hypothetical protein
MSDKDFVLAGDGWVQVTPCGEFPHVGAGPLRPAGAAHELIRGRCPPPGCRLKNQSALDPQALRF